MSDIKVVAWQEDLDAIEREINARTGNTEKLSFPDEFITEIPNMKDYLDMYVTGELTEYTSYVKEIPDYMFCEYEAIKKIDFPNAIKAGIRSMNGCANLLNVNAPKLKSGGYYLFENCTSIETINLPLFENTGDGCFKGCTSLKQVYLPSFINSFGSGHHFTECVSLENIDLPMIENIGTATFKNNTALKTVIIPQAKSIGNYAFENCTALEAVVIKRSDFICEISEVSIFKNSSVESGTGFIYVPDNLVKAYKNATNWSVYANQIRPLSEYIEA